MPCVGVAPSNLSITSILYFAANWRNIVRVHVTEQRHHPRIQAKRVRGTDADRSIATFFATISFSIHLCHYHEYHFCIKRGRKDHRLPPLVCVCAITTCETHPLFVIHASITLDVYVLDLLYGLFVVRFFHSVLYFFFFQGRSLGEVTKYLVYNMRKRQEGGDSAEKYFNCTEQVRTCGCWRCYFLFLLFVAVCCCFLVASGLCSLLFPAPPASLTFQLHPVLTA